MPLDQAKLITIGVSPNSPWALFNQNIECEEPFPSIHNLPPGEYGLGWDLVGQAGEVFVLFRLYDGGQDSIDEFVLPALPYFSGQIVAMRASGIFGDPRPTISALKDLFNIKTLKEDPLNLANKFANIQAQAFHDEISKYIDFKSNDHAKSELHLMISFTIIMFGSDRLIDSSVVVLPDSKPS